VIVTYYVNLSPGKYFGYKSDHLVTLAAAVAVSTDDDLEAAERAFVIFNRIAGPIPALDASEAESMSVGDVVEIRDLGDSRWYSVQSVGFERIEPPTVAPRGSRTVAGLRAHLEGAGVLP
jgi:hypothetical protein